MSEYSYEEAAKYPPPGTAVPSSFKFNFDGSHVMYLNASPEKSTLQLYRFHIKEGQESVFIGTPKDGGVSEESLTPEEELRRQRARMLSTGITSYLYNAESDRILVPLNGTVFLHDSSSGELHPLVTGAITPTMSEDGKQLFYVQDSEVYALDLEQSNAVARQLTTGARGTGKTNGLAEYIAQEEFHRNDGFWISPDAKQVAYCEVDETHIPLYTIVHQGKEDLASEDHHYPFAGAENARVRLLVNSVEEGDSCTPLEMNLNYEGDSDMEEVYIADVFWWNNGQLGAEILNRAQTRLDLLRFDMTTGERTVVLQEHSASWVNLFDHGHFTQLKDGRFLWMSERDGFAHLYLVQADGQTCRQLTRGSWIVDELVTVDEEAQLVYFTGNCDDPTQKHFYSVSYREEEEGKSHTQISQGDGLHSVVVDPTCRFFIDRYASLQSPPSIHLRSLKDGSSLHQLFTSSDPRVELFQLQPPEIVTFQNRSGVTIKGAMYRPDEQKYGPGPYPVVVYVYGGPGPQVVQNNWTLTSNMKLQILRQKGFLVFTMDNQGSARRGLEFESQIHRCMGTVEVDDQVDGVHWLVEQKLADPQRVGITGWSYGGYMTLLCLMKAPEVFRVGVAGAPVTLWELYDTAYTERYMSTPQENPEGYKKGSVLEYASQLKGKLLLIHGLLDENVLFRHTARLLNALNRERKTYDLLLFPDERHMPRHESDRVFLSYRLIHYFEEHLLHNK